MDWYYMFAADQRGPVSSQALVSMITSGELHSSVLVWSDGMNDFVPAADVPDLASLIAAALAPPAPSEPALDSGEPDQMKIARQTYRDLLDMAVVDGAISPRQGEMLAVKKHALGLSPTDPEILGMETELLGTTLDAHHAEQSDSARSSAADAVSATLDGEHESTGEPQSLPVAPPELKHHLSPESAAVREEATVAASPPVPARTAELPVTTARSDTSKPAAAGEARSASSGKAQPITSKSGPQVPKKDGNKGCISQMVLGCVWAFLIAFLAVIIVSILIWYSEEYDAGAARSEQEKQALTAQAKAKEEKSLVKREIETVRKIVHDDTPKVLLKTSQGDIVLELNAAKAPVTVENFLGYVKTKHYDGTVFHRVIDGFMIQGGGFAVANGGLVEKATGKGITNEGQNGLKNERGTIAMARTNDPNSATAQFFINVVDNAMLDHPNNGGYAVFGKVVEGMNVVDKIKVVPTGTSKLTMLNPASGEKMEMPSENVPTNNVVILTAIVE